MVIVVDTREQFPYTFEGEGIATVRRALPAGDYSIDGYESQIAVERKSLQDYVNTTIHNKGRFREELKKLMDYRAACIVVEASMLDILNRKYVGATDPKSVIGGTVGIIGDYRIPVFFCGARPLACYFTLRWLQKHAAKAAKWEPTHAS